MFRQLAVTLAGPAPNQQQLVNGANAALTGWHPQQLADYLERYWRAPRANIRIWGPGVNIPAHRQLARFVAAGPANNFNAPPPLPGAQVTWHHLVYALMVEQTAILNVFERVIHEWQHSEQLPAATMATQRWLRASEELFFTHPRFASITSLASSIRPDSDAIRRNAYFRLLGMDVLHAGRGAFVKPEASNHDFAATFLRLLREVWRGYINVNNGIGPNNTDIQAILELLRRLREMLTARRLAGVLSREEFAAVATLSWFHLVLEHNTSIVVNLAAQSTSAADRLRKIGERLGVPVHSRTDSFLQLADPMSIVLLNIESGAIEAQPNPAAALYGFPGAAGAWTAEMLQIIHHWSIVTGENIKESFEPRSLPSVVPTAALTHSNGNGSRIPAGRF